MPGLRARRRVHSSSRAGRPAVVFCSLIRFALSGLCGSRCKAPHVRVSCAPMRRDTLIKSILVAVLFFFAGTPSAFAWGVGGHKVVALIAFEQMSEETRAKAIALLEKH